MVKPTLTLKSRWNINGGIKFLYLTAYSFSLRLSAVEHRPNKKEKFLDSKVSRSFWQFSFISLGPNSAS